MKKMNAAGNDGSTVPEIVPVSVTDLNKVRAFRFAAISSALLCGVSILSGCGTSTNSTAAVPTFTPAAGSYTSAQTVTISDTTPGAVLYCTTDGSKPTTSSPVCNEPTTVAKTETLSAIAAEPGGGASAAATAAYVINLPASATPVISPAAGTYIAAQSVTISDATAGAAIYYTTDGSAPTASSTLYSGAITVSATETVSAIAVASGYADSNVASSAYTINLPAPAPVITPAGGTFTGAQAVSISDPVAGATIYYTLDGSTPTQASTVYSGGITVSASETVSAVAIAPGYSLSPVTTAAFNLVAAVPVISPAGGSFTSVQNVTLTDATAGAAIYYTVTPNGSAPATPTTASTLYTSAIQVAASETIEAIAVATGYTQSAAASAAFTVNLPPAATPVLSPAGGTFSIVQTVTISDSTAGAAIYYTTNGSTPSASNGTLYSGAISVSSSETIEAVAVAFGSSNSAVASAVFNLTTATPGISPGAGTYTSVQSVTLTDATTGAAVYYTTNGSTPSASNGTMYAGPIQVASSETIEAIAIATGYGSSAVATASYTINLPSAATPTISPAGGTFGSQTEPTVTIGDATSGAAIYYTLDGSLPGAASGTLYTAPFTVGATETVKAVAVAFGYANSAVATASFTINQAAAATPTISPAAGTYTSSQSVTLSDTTPNAAIYYSTDGSTPSAQHGTLYAGAITVATTETIKAIATASGFNNSAVASAAFTINLAPAATPAFSPGTGTYNSPQTVSITDATAGAAIYYTTDGSAPTAGSSLYNGTSITVSATETVKAIAVAAGYSNSAAGSASYTLAAAVPSIAPNGGTFTTASDSISIADVTPGVSIYYTVTAGSTGTVPTTSSTLYAGAFSISATDTVEAIAVETGYTTSGAASATFTQMVSSGPAVAGTVSSGSQPISGASVQMYAAGTTGYGSAGTAIGAAVTTGANGGFSIPYTCPAAPGDLIYVVATGGSVSATGASNGGLGLMTALGHCANLPTTAITVNEVTTVASVYSLSGFAALASGGGISIGAPAPTVTCSSTNVGNASCNYPGLANAFATVNNLVDVGGGTALTITPAYAANPLPYLNTSTVPQARIDTLADILATCVEASSGCATLFGDVGGTVPVDTIQAALDIALNPGAHVAALYGLLQTTPPYTPTLASAGDTAAPGDWTLAITYTGAGLGVDPNADYNDNITNLAIALDSTGEVWVTGATTNSESTGLVAGFSNTGAPLTPATQYDATNQFVTQYGGFGAGMTPLSSGVSQLIVGPTNNLWISDGSFFGNGTYFSEISVTPNAGAVPTLAVVQLASAYMGAVSIGNAENSFAFDPSGNLWLSTTSPTFNEYSSTDGSLLNQYTSTESSLNDLVFDTNGSLWASGSGDALVYNTSSGNALATYANTGGGALAASSSGTILTCSASSGYEALESSTTTGPVATYSVTAGCNPLTVDGAGTIWSVSGTNAGNYLTEVSSGGVTVTPSGGYTGSSSAEVPTTFDAFYLAVDGSGNLWSLNQNNSIQNGGTTGDVLVEFVGVASPTVTPLAVAVQNGTQGTRP